MSVRSKPSDSALSGSPRKSTTASASRACATASSTARRERHVHPVGHTGAQLVERDVDAGRVHLGAAGALEARGPREVADHGQPLAVAQVEGQQAVVLEQHRALARGPPGQVVVRVEVRRRGRGGLRERVVDERQHPGDGLVEGGLVQRPGPHRLDDRAVAVAQLRRHLEVEPGGDRGGPVVHRAPVGDDQAVEAPLLAQHLGQQPVVLGGVDAVDLVVGAHHRPRLGQRDHPLEGRQVDLAQRPLVDVGADPGPVGLLVVGGEVLQRGADALGLHADHERRTQLAGEPRVLGEVLEVAAAQRRALDVDTRPQEHRDVLGPGLPAERLPHLAHQVDVPRGGERRRGREAGRRHALPQGAGPLALLAQPVRAVGDHHRRDPQPLHRRRVPEVRADAQRGLLLEGQLVQQLRDVQLTHGPDPSLRATPPLGVIVVTALDRCACGARSARACPARPKTVSAAPLGPRSPASLPHASRAALQTPPRAGRLG